MDSFDMHFPSGAFPSFPRPEGVFSSFNFHLWDSLPGIVTVYDKGFHYKILTDPETQAFFSKSTPPVEDLKQVTIYAFEKNKEIDKIYVRLFVSHDGAKVLKYYDELEVFDDELAIFLELDDAYNFTGSIVRIKAGSEVLGMSDLPLNEIVRFVQSHRVNLSQEDLRDLLRGAHLSKKALLYWLWDSVSLASGLSVLMLPHTASLGKRFFLDILPGFLENIRADETLWRRPLDTLSLNHLKRNGKHYVSQAVNGLFKPLLNQEELWLKALDKISFFSGFKGRLRGFIKRLFAKIKEAVKFLSENLFDLLYSGLHLLWAFLVGLYNSLIDTVKGISVLLGRIFYFLEKLTDPDYLPYYFSYALELVENITEGVLKTDWKEVMSGFVGLARRVYRIIKDYVSDIDIYEVAYFSGYLMGFIVETVISVLFTGGQLTFRSVLQRIIAEPLRMMAGGIKKLFESAKTLLEKIHIFVRKLFDKLRRPKQAFRELFEVVEGVLKKSPEKLRAATLRKWAHVFDEYFYNHLSGDVAKEKITIFFHDIWYIVPKGEGGHFLNKYVKVKEILYPEGIRTINQLPGDTPFIAKIDVVSEAGKRFPKRVPSSMFPKNWTYERIREEVAWVYEKAQSNDELIIKKPTLNNFGKIEGETTTGFKIIIEVDHNGKIMNAYPKLEIQ